ncbi:MAG: SsrA-binding protein SmpB [Acidobacteriota bacterium]
MAKKNPRFGGGKRDSSSSKERPIKMLARNKRARFDYHILEVVEAGIELSGTEVKAARAGKIQLKEAYVDFSADQAWLVGAHISPYSHGNRMNHEATQRRRLLLHRREIDRFRGRSQAQRLTVVPLSMYLKGSWIKVEIGLAQGKQAHDKRETERRKEQEKEAREAVKQQRW